MAYCCRLPAQAFAGLDSGISQVSSPIAQALIQGGLLKQVRFLILPDDLEEGILPFIGDHCLSWDGGFECDSWRIFSIWTFSGGISVVRTFHTILQFTWK